MAETQSLKRKSDSGVFGDEDDVETSIDQPTSLQKTEAEGKQVDVSDAKKQQAEEPSSVSDGKKEETTSNAKEKELVSSMSMDKVTAKVLGNTPYFRIRYGTLEMFEKCLLVKQITWKKSQGGHGYMAPIVFDNMKLQKLIKELNCEFHVKEKKYSPQKMNNFYFQTVPVHLPYGYSPSVPPGSKEPSNKLTIDLTSVYDEEEMEGFVAGIEAMDTALGKVARSLFENYQNGIFNKNMDSEMLDKLFKEKWKSPFKTSKTLTFALDTIKENPKTGIEADPYTAKLRVWNDSCEDSPLTEVLSRENSCLYDPQELKKKSKNKNEEFPPQKIIIVKGAWAIVGAVLNRFFINETCLNYQIMAYDVFLQESPTTSKGNPFK